VGFAAEQNEHRAQLKTSQQVGEHVAYRVSGESMSPNIPEGCTVIIRRKDYAPPRDVIVCWTPEE